ncbi:MAG TPA: cupin domain-containing protein [Xanthomonadaceae bacterium]|jgi:quercetin dioxygenase-like cupin family protein
MQAEADSALQTIACDDLDAAIALQEREHGYRLDMVMPADAPRIALLSRGGDQLRLQRRDTSSRAGASTNEPRAFTITHARDDMAWSIGRAGMQYRDLIPGRLGGRAIASHIRIPEGGDVPDRVHYHDVHFQMIFCRKGWVRVVYEDQGPPLTMRAGDCVLQPPTIRHRVLEASPGLEVVELACPAEHPTWIDHELALPTARNDPARSFAGQRFLHHVANEAAWLDSDASGVHLSDLGIAEATSGLAGARVLRLMAGTELSLASPTFDAAQRGALFLYVLDGSAILHDDASGHHAMDRDSACTILNGAPVSIRAANHCELLAVALPA